tara:strand:+ start:487 stop:588 length:102 start_codon:yes stop_codon:yes gene_type:complete
MPYLGIHINEPTIVDGVVAAHTFTDDVAVQPGN